MRAFAVLSLKKSGGFDSMFGKLLWKIRWKRIILLALLFFLLYFILASILPYLTQKKVSAAYAESFDPQEFYSEELGSERVLCVDENLDALLWRFRLMEQAQKELIYVSFDFVDDTSGTDVIAGLLSAAERGVQVKLLVDGFSSTWILWGSEAFQALASHPNVEMKIYNPAKLIKPWRNQARLHDKYVIVDNTMYLLGGRNTSDYFLGDYHEKPNIDREILVYDTAPSNDHSLGQLKSYFSSVWNLPDCKSYAGKDTPKAQETREQLLQRYEDLKQTYPESFTSTDWIGVTTETNKVSLLSNPVEPVNKEPRLWHSLVQLMQTGDTVLIQTPYVICSNDMYTDLKTIQDAGTQVSILTNSPESGANVFGTSDFRLERKTILDTGVNVYEFAGHRSNHTKGLLIGNRLSIIGSFNMDMRSAYLDTELMVVVDSEKFQTQMQSIVEEALSQSRKLQPDGTYTYGENYTGKNENPIVAVISVLLGLISRPFRFLL